MKTQNKIIILIMVSLLMGQFVAFGAANDYTTETYSVNKSEIRKDDTFQLTLDLINIGDLSFNGDNQPYLVLSNTNFENADGLSKITFADENNIDLNLKYIGNENSFYFKIYDSDGDLMGDESIIISEAKEYSESSGSSTPTDTSKYKSLLTVNQDTIKSYTAGTSVDLEVPIKNIGKYSARSVLVSLDLSEGPFKNKNVATDSINYISSEETEIASFDLDISDVSKNMVYKIPVSITSQNAYGDAMETVTGIYTMRVNNGQTPPTLGIYEHDIRGNIFGDDGGIVLSIKNFGDVDAKDVTLTLSGFSKDGFRLVKDISSKYMGSIKGNAIKKEYFLIKANDQLWGKTGELTVNYSYSDDEGNQYNLETPLYVDLDGFDSSESSLRIENLTYDQTVTTGKDLNIAFDLKNTGTVQYEKVEVVLEYPNQMISKTPKKIILRDFNANNSEKGHFTIYVDEQVPSENYNFFIKVKGYPVASIKDNYDELEQYFGVFVKGGNEKGRPKLIVDNYEFEGSNVLAGESFPLTLYIKNTSDVQQVRNIKVSVASNENIFMPVNTSSSFFIDAIGSNETFEKIIELKTKRDAAVKSYNLKVTMEYEDAQGNAYDSQGNILSETDDLSISVLQPIRLETSDIMLPMDLQVGRPGNLEVEFYNMGRSTMNNMMIKAEGDFQIQNASYFKGTFQPGGNDYFSATIIPEHPGLLEGKIIFSFEDAIGNLSTIEKSFQVNAREAELMGNENMPPEFNENMPEDMNPNQGPNKLLIIGGGILLFIVALVVYLKRRKKNKLKKLMEFDDIDDE